MQTPLSLASRRTKAEQEVMAFIAPLVKLGRFDAHVVANYFFQNNVLQFAYRVG